MTTLRVSDLGEMFDGPHATPTRRDEGPYFLNISSLDDGRLDLDQSDHVSDADFRKWTKRVTPRAGDLLFSYETRLGSAALMPEGVRACLGRRMALIRPDRRKVDPRFLLYLYLSPNFQRIIQSHTVHGATVSRIPLNRMGGWKVDLPPLPEQRAIAEVLGALDDKIAANRQLTVGSAELAQRSYQQARLLALPTWRRLDSLVSTQYGFTVSASDCDGPLLIRVTDINKYPWIEWANAPSCQIDEGDREKYKLCEGDIVLARMADPGKPAYVDANPPESVFASYLVRIRAKDQDLALYLYHFLRSSEYQRYASGVMSGSVQKNINARVMVEAEVRVPDSMCLRQFNRVVRALRESMMGALRENERLANTRDALLPLLMSGKVRVKDVEDEVGELV